MTLPEKADQMRGTPKGNGQYTDIFRTLDNTGKGIKGFLFRDGPRGVNLAAGLPEGKTGYATAFPVSIARGAAFDMDLEQRVGAAIGDETLASGNTMILAPTVNILRTPLCPHEDEELLSIWADIVGRGRQIDGNFLLQLK